MPTNSGIITLMGSGELTATMVEVHKELLNRYGDMGEAVFIDTPAGFQLNADQIAQKAQDYFESRVQHSLSVASLKSMSDDNALAIEQCYQAVDRADYILIGPGSPTYAVQQWQQSNIPRLITQTVQRGGCLVAASAAALTVGRLTLPVYEIYKVGQAPHWVEGLNILEAFGFDLVVIPHWNNAEGGNHDTRFCFMGAARLRQLEQQIPPSASVLGLDEHTALIIDLARDLATIRGIGHVTLQRRGDRQIFAKGDEVPLDVFRGQKPSVFTVARPQVSINEPKEQAAASQDPVWHSLRVMEKQVQDNLDDNRAEQATGALLAMERHIWKFINQLQEQDEVGAAREVLREMVALLGAHAAARPESRKTCLAPLVDALLTLRGRLRELRQWDAADAVRDCLEHAKVVVKDTSDGVQWHIDE